MPDGPLAAAIILVVGLVLLGIGYVLTEGLRPGRRGRHRREAERLPLFGTDQLVLRRHGGEEPADDADEEAHEPAPPPRPMQRPEHRRPEPRPDRQNGRHDTPQFRAAEPPHPQPAPPAPRPREVLERHEPTAPLPPSLPPAVPARPAAAQVRDEQTYVWPAVTAPAAPVRAGASAGAPAPGAAPPAPAPAAADAAFVDGETLRFAVPTDGTLQFLPGRLEVIAGPDTGREVRFVRTPGEDTTQVTFGRAEGPVYRHVQLHARTVSRQHAMMSLIDEHWELRNLSMTNPVVLNGRLLAHNEVAPLLVDGDRIEMGEVVFLFHDR